MDELQPFAPAVSPCLRAGLVALLEVDAAPRAVAPAWGRRRRLRGGFLTRARSFVLYSSDEWSTPSPSPAGIVVDANYAKDSDEEHMVFDMMLREGELARETDIICEQEERRRAIALVEAYVARERGLVRVWGLPYPEFEDWVTVPDDAAVLCAVDDCDHLDCHGGPFLVVHVGTDEDGVALICWPKAHVGNALYFPCTSSTIILRYDLSTQELSMITWPAMYKWENANHILIRTEDGVLGCASLQESRLELWSMESRTDGSVKWVLSRVVELENWLPSPPSHVTRFADGVGIFFVRTNLGIFTVELKSGRVKKISNSKVQVIPYMSFYTPDQSGGIKPPSTMTSSSENVETTRDEHHDLLLQHSSGEVGDVKEKWVEKGEEDCEWKEGGWHEEGSVEDWEWKGEKAAQELFEKGSKAIDEGHFVDAKKFLHRALKSRYLHIFLALKLASKIRDALPYAVKVSLLYKSRMQKLIRANEALLAVKGDNASAAEFGSEMPSLDNEIEVLSSISTVLEEKVTSRPDTRNISPNLKAKWCA
ncbi:hypothetical protein ACQ4PT_040443 [Festuca glaucescens]